MKGQISIKMCTPSRPVTNTDKLWVEIINPRIHEKIYYFLDKDAM